MREQDLYQNVVITSRIRVARNVKGISFALNKDLAKREDLISKVAVALMPLGKYKVYKISALSEVDSKVMFGKHLISKDLINNKQSGAVIIRNDEKVSVMVNEEDHIREQCILPGMQLDKAFSLINEIDDELSSKLDFAYSDKYGYLTSCVTNVGTGLRASVMLFLPALTLQSEIDGIINAVKSKGLTVRGVTGEGSASLGYMYQVSNAISIGISEREIISMVNSAVTRICELEQVARKKILETNPEYVTDLSWRAYGILTNCYTIDYEEFMKLAGEVKLGIALGLIVLTDNSFIDKLIDYCSDSAIIKLCGKNLSDEEIGQFRAGYLYKNLKNFRIK
ncbi:MAG: ATP--guanido phosphotransferase [Christensenellales bacterium]